MLPPCHLDHGLALLRIAGQGLLTDHMLTALHHADARLSMGIICGRYDHQVDISPIHDPTPVPAPPHPPPPDVSRRLPASSPTPPPTNHRHSHSFTSCIQVSGVSCWEFGC